MLLRINIMVIFVLNLLYVFRSLAVVLNIENLMYIFTVLVIGINMIYLLATLNKQKINIISTYVVLGIIILIYSMLLNPLIVGIMGFSVIFFNLLLWDTFIRSTNKKNLYLIFNNYVKWNVYFACVTSIIGVYQYFVDPSIMGLALHDIYGSVEMMESGRFVRRVTSLMGSPQNYSLYLAITTSLVSYAMLSKKIKILVYLILLFGGLVSGSRAYSVFIISVVLTNFAIKSTVRVRFYEKFIKKSILFVLSMGLIILIFNQDFSNTTINRMFKLLSDWPALEIYKYHLSKLSATNFLLGKGLGVNERIVLQFLGARYYNLIGGYLNSYESYFLSIFMQLGIFGLLLFVLVYIKSMINAYKNLGVLYVSILFAILINLIVTPSFNGLAMSFIIWPLILIPCYIKNELEFYKGAQNYEML